MNLRLRSAWGKVSAFDEFLNEDAGVYELANNTGPR